MTRPLKDNDTLRQDFEAYLLLERSLSPNTASAYLTDVGHLVDFLDSRSITASSATEDDLHLLLSTLRDIGISPVRRHA